MSVTLKINVRLHVVSRCEESSIPRIRHKHLPCLTTPVECSCLGDPTVIQQRPTPVEQSFFHARELVALVTARVHGHCAVWRAWHPFSEAQSLSFLFLYSSDGLQPTCDGLHLIASLLLVALEFTNSSKGQTHLSFIGDI